MAQPNIPFIVAPAHKEAEYFCSFMHIAKSTISSPENLRGLHDARVVVVNRYRMSDKQQLDVQVAIVGRPTVSVIYVELP